MTTGTGRALPDQCDDDSLIIAMAFAVLVIYLRQRGSPESKPLAAASEGATGEEG
jgi:hypothetical protein